MLDPLLQIATAVRSFMEPVWDEWHAQNGRIPPDVGSQNTCGRTSLFLQRALQFQGVAARWTNGVPRHSDDGPEIAPCGFLTAHRWESHAWVECEGYIIDVTADQFAADPVIVTPTSDRRYRRGNVDSASRASIEARRTSVDRIWPIWIASAQLRSLPVFRPGAGRWISGS